MVRLMGWIFEELGTKVEWPMQIQTDSPGAEAFKKDACPYSKLKGCFSYRWDWVQELRQDTHIKTKFVEDLKNLADVFTRCMTGVKFGFRVQQILSLGHRIVT